MSKIFTEKELATLTAISIASEATAGDDGLLYSFQDLDKEDLENLQEQIESLRDSSDSDILFFQLVRTIVKDIVKGE